jgi:hypothetical protein
LQYVGCTNNFRKRANQHKSIISGRLAKPECFRLYEHFSQLDHSFSDVRFTILGRTSPQNLEEQENSRKSKLNTIYPGGLNVVAATWSSPTGSKSFSLLGRHGIVYVILFPW